MLRISKLTDYASVVLSCIAEEPSRLHSAVELAGKTRLEAPTVSKLLKQLAKAGIVDSVRGAHGGYRLARDPGQVSLAEIIVAMEGPIGMTECGAEPGLCGHEHQCSVSGNWRLISQVIERALRGVTLAELAAPTKPARLRSIGIPVQIAD